MTSPQPDTQDSAIGAQPCARIVTHSLAEVTNHDHIHANYAGQY
jgi:hypothetical protein